MILALLAGVALAAPAAGSPAVALSADQLAVAMPGDRLQVVDLATLAPTWQLPLGRTGVEQMAWIDGALVVVKHERWLVFEDGELRTAIADNDLGRGVSIRDAGGGLVIVAYYTKSFLVHARTGACTWLASDSDLPISDLHGNGARVDRQGPVSAAGKCLAVPTSDAASCRLDAEGTSAWCPAAGDCVAAIEDAAVGPTAFATASRSEVTVWDADGSERGRWQITDGDALSADVPGDGPAVVLASEASVDVVGLADGVVRYRLPLSLEKPVERDGGWQFEHVLLRANGWTTAAPAEPPAQDKPRWSFDSTRGGGGPHRVPRRPAGLERGAAGQSHRHRRRHPGARAGRRRAGGLVERSPVLAAHRPAGRHPGIVGTPVGHRERGLRRRDRCGGPRGDRSLGLDGRGCTPAPAPPARQGRAAPGGPGQAAHGERPGERGGLDGIALALEPATGAVRWAVPSSHISAWTAIVQ